MYKTDVDGVYDPHEEQAYNASRIHQFFFLRIKI